MPRDEHQQHSTKSITLALASLGAGLVIGAMATIGHAEMAPPTEHQGVGVTGLGVVSEESMQKQLGLDGRVLQLREITIEPGGAIAKHDHATRPGLVWMSEGTWIEGRADGERAYAAGKPESIVEDADTVHWFYNRGSSPATAIVCDVVPAS